MTLGRTWGVGLTGIDGFMVEVEAQLGPGLPGFTIVGLGDSAVKQAPDRIRAACTHLGWPVSQKKLVVNLSPASRQKVGSGFDVAIAVAALAATGVVQAWVVDGVAHLGELGLDGTIRPVTGILPTVQAARRAGIRHIVVPLANAAEARLAGQILVHPARDLAQLVDRYAALAHGQRVEDPVVQQVDPVAPAPVPDLADVVGQEEVRLALEVAAAGGHHLFMVGPPGAGKTMLAERLPGLLPPLPPDLALEVSAIRSILDVPGAMPGLVERAPFVAPHHGASAAAIIGGGSGRVRPGAITRAHGGVLFLDEAAEFKTSVLQALRQPIESGQIVVARAHDMVCFPARFQLVLAANPCPCGMLVGKGDDCSCTPLKRRGYLTRLGGPLLDRVDLQVHVAAPGRAHLAGPPGEPSSAVAARVAAAIESQERRWQGMPWRLNGRAPGPLLRSLSWRLAAERTRELDLAIDRGWLSLRGYDRCLRLAWTLADLRGAVTPEARDVAEALSLRQSTPAAA